MRAGFQFPIRIISEFSLRGIINKFYLSITKFSLYNPPSTNILVSGYAANIASLIVLKGPFF